MYLMLLTCTLKMLMYIYPPPPHKFSEKDIVLLAKVCICLNHIFQRVSHESIHEKKTLFDESAREPSVHKTHSSQRSLGRDPHRKLLSFV